MSAPPVGAELGSTELDLHAAALRSLLPAPVRASPLPSGGWLLSGGEPAMVTVRLTPAGARIGPARLRFWGPKPVLVEERLAALPWALLPADEALATAMWRGLIDAAVAVRRAELLPCPWCRAPRAPEEAAIAARSGRCVGCGAAAEAR